MQRHSDAIWNSRWRSWRPMQHTCAALPTCDYPTEAHTPETSQPPESPTPPGAHPPYHHNIGQNAGSRAPRPQPHNGEGYKQQVEAASLAGYAPSTPAHPQQVSGSALCSATMRSHSWCIWCPDAPCQLPSRPGSQHAQHAYVMHSSGRHVRAQRIMIQCPRRCPGNS